MSSQAAAGRLARLAAHLSVDGEAPSSSAAAGLDRQPTAAAATAAADATSTSSAAHLRCYNFEPGRLLLDQVAIVTGAGAGIGKAVGAGAPATVLGCLVQGARLVCMEGLLPGVPSEHWSAWTVLRHCSQLPLCCAAAPWLGPQRCMQEAACTSGVAVTWDDTGLLGSTYDENGRSLGQTFRSLPLAVWSKQQFRSLP